MTSLTFSLLSSMCICQLWMLQKHTLQPRPQYKKVTFDFAKSIYISTFIETQYSSCGGYTHPNHYFSLYLWCYLPIAGHLDQAYEQLKEATYLYSRVCEDLHHEACYCHSLLARVAFLKGKAAEASGSTTRM